MTNTSLVTFNGETVERYKNQVRVLSHKPHLLLQWGHWVCVSHNARGQGGYGQLDFHGVRTAYISWLAQQIRFKRMQDHGGY